MTDAVVEKQTCEKCGVDRRQGTTFCYKCGVKLDDKVELEPAAPSTLNGSRSADAIEEKAIDKPKTPIAEEDAGASPRAIAVGRKLSDAAKDRRRARVVAKSPRDDKLEAGEEPGNRTFRSSAVLRALIALGIGLLRVWWKETV